MSQLDSNGTARVGGGHRGVTEIVRSLESTLRWIALKFANSNSALARMVQIVRRARRRVWSKYSNAQRVSSLHLSKGPLESAIAVRYVFQFSGRSRDGGRVEGWRGAP